MTGTVFFGSRSFKPPRNPVVTMGVFDGVHLGHRELFKRTLERAKKIRGTAVVYTFSPHPVKILAPQACPLMINTLDQKIELIQSQGIRSIVIEKFNKNFSHQTPEIFFKKIIVERLQAQEIYVGYNFTFGIHRSGNIEHLEAFGRKAGIRIHVVEPFLNDETLVSSSHIRHLLAHGDLPEAERLLARPYFIEGKVIRGRGIGGRVMGIHTANLQTDNDLILPAGVYITRTRIGKKNYPSATNIGCNPTFGPGTLSIETHLLDFRRSILHQRIHVSFLKKIREEVAFASSEALLNQIQNDIRMTRKYFKPQAGK